MALRPPPFAIQNVVLESLGKGKHQPSVWEYAVAKEWLEHYRKVIKGYSQEDPLVTPITMYTYDKDNQYISHSLWSILVSWFGVDKSHNLRRRHAFRSCFDMTNKEGKNISILGDNKSDFVLIRVGMFGGSASEETFAPLIAYIWDSVDYLVVQVKRCLGTMIPNCRIWLKFSREDEIEYLAPIESEATTLLSVVLVSVFPELADILKIRETQYSPDYPSYGGGKIRKMLYEDFIDQNICISLFVEEMVNPSPRDGDCENAFVIERNIGHNLSDTENAPKDQCSVDWEESLTDTLNTLTLGIDSMKTETASKLLEQAKVIVTFRLKEVREMEERLVASADTLSETQMKLKEAEETVRQKEQDLNNKLAKFKVNLTDYLIKQKNLDDEMRAIESMNVITDSVIRVNVGGHVYTTSTETLCRAPDSLLATMFGGKHAVAKDKNGDYFIDRDGTMFKQILDFLRDGDQSLIGVDNSNTLHCLLREAKYFRLLKLEAVVNARLTNAKDGAFQSI